MKAPLISGDYQARSVIASAQRCVNLYMEKNADSAPFPFTCYYRPGLTQLVAPDPPWAYRTAYAATNGQFFEVIGPHVYYTNQLWQRTLLGVISYGTTPVSMSDNGLAILMVDGSPNGWTIDLATHSFAQVTGQGDGFHGGDRVDCTDGFFILNVPGTNQWYCSLENVSFANLTGTVNTDAVAAAFYDLAIATKSGNADPLAGVIAMRLEPWLLGTDTSEVWQDAGASPFPFVRIPGVFIEHGCVAKYSIAKQDLSVYWLSKDRQGQTIVLMGNDYAARRISTHAIEQQMQGYATVSDAVGMTYQQLGHTFYVLTFPAADATWAYDVGENLWHEEVWTDDNGVEHRHRAAAMAAVYGENVCGDWQTGALYRMDLNNFTDNGASIIRRRGFPIMQQENSRVEYTRLVLDVDVGEIADTAWTIPGGVSDAILDSQGHPILDSDGNPINGDYTMTGGSPAYPVPFGPKISLRWSDDRGKNWSNPILKDIGATGEYNRSVLQTRMGIGRNRVYETFWDCNCFTAVNGGDVFFERCET